MPASLLPWPLSLLANLPPHIVGAALVYAAAYGTGLFAFAWMARRRGLDTAGVRSVAVAGLLGGLVGANIAQFLFGGAAGKTILGGIAGGYLTVVLYKRRLGLLRPLGDLFAVGVTAGEAVGRWGCLLGGCCYGHVVAPGSLPWAVYQHGAWRHPAQAYLSLASLFILGVLLWRELRRPLPENGLFFLQGALYTAARFGVEFFREGRSLAVGLTAAQWACLAGFAFFTYRFARLTRAGAPARVLPPSSPVPGAAA
jgi:phosphatidylglycerol:prolipoprotein diacylglycerol transferase